VKVSRLGQQLNCSFCRKPQGDVKMLIASADRAQYICNECTFEPTRLKVISSEPVIQPSGSSSTPSKVFGFLWGGRRRQLSCSFCQKRITSSVLYRSSSDDASQAQICGDCLDICRQILTSSVPNADAKPGT
jgi:hypothetical protein